MRVHLLLLLLACKQIPAPAGTQGGVAPQAEASQADDSEATLTLHLRGSSAAGMVVAVAGTPDRYLASGKDLVVVVNKGTSVQVSAEGLARVGSGGSRMVRGEHAYVVNENRDETIVLEDILYVGAFAHTDNLYALSFDGTQSRALTHFTAPGLFIRDLSVSPNGEWVAYVSNRALGGGDATGPASNLWVQPAHSIDAVALTRSFNADSSAPAWAPDSRSLVFASALPLRAGETRNAFVNVWHVDVQTRALHAVTALSSAWSDKPAFDGQSVAFISSRALSGVDAAGPAAFLWVSNVDGSDAHWLTDIVASPSQAPLLSSEGVAFAACDNLSCSMRSLATVRMDASEPQRLAALAPSAFPAFARQGDGFALLGVSQLRTLDWNGTQKASTPVALPIAIYGGGFYVTEVVDSSVPSSDWHLHGGFDKRFSVDALGAVAVTP